MYKKLLVLAVALGMSASASAAFVQYRIWDAKFDDGNPLSGWFVQNTDTRGIAYFLLFSNQHAFSPNVSATITNARVLSPDAPTSFDVGSGVIGGPKSQLHLEFGPGARPGWFTLAGSEWFPPINGRPAETHAIVTGRVEVDFIDPGLLGLLQSGTSLFTEVVPPGTFPPGPEPVAGYVPEPGSLALIAAGLGLMGRLRSRYKRASRNVAA